MTVIALPSASAGMELIAGMKAKTGPPTHYREAKKSMQGHHISVMKAAAGKIGASLVSTAAGNS
jgi:hypothetical protein